MTSRLVKNINAPAISSDRLKLHAFAACNSIEFTFSKIEINLRFCNGMCRTLCLNVIITMKTKTNIRIKVDY